MVPASSEARDSRTARPNSPSRPGTNPLRRLFDRSSLRAAITLAIAGLALVLLAVEGTGYWRLSPAVGALERAQYSRLATETRNRIERLVTRDRSRLREAAFSDELYRLVARGPAPPDSFIRPPFTGWFPRQYGDQFVGLYGLDGTPLFVWSDEEHDFESVAVENSFLRILDNREPAAGLVRR